MTRPQAKYSLWEKMFAFLRNQEEQDFSPSSQESSAVSLELDDQVRDPQVSLLLEVR